MAPMAGASVSHSPMVTTIDVTYPNGRMPASTPTMPAKIISSHALRKKAGPAAKSPKKLPMLASHLFRIPRAFIRVALLGRLPGGEHQQVAHRQHADHLAVVDHGQVPDAKLEHAGGNLLGVLPGAGAGRREGHVVADRGCRH